MDYGSSVEVIQLFSIFRNSPVQETYSPLPGEFQLNTQPHWLHVILRGTVPGGKYRLSQIVFAHRLIHLIERLKLLDILS
jgi:hypothetical protein